ncbi:hypothetical protein L1987_24299 [Smallanthus sonchifolius]|uniref:Uncharacterized protein n=1 Tax=Smallanthus sonchifolius TaxID=185202 RepID=A0ACB9IK27_9ASTR|nr:hypothetical protein L1987_24299 [Smallanthus sonchifolius]
MPPYESQPPNDAATRLLKSLESLKQQILETFAEEDMIKKEAEEVRLRKQEEEANQKEEVICISELPIQEATPEVEQEEIDLAVPTPSEESEEETTTLQEYTAKNYTCINDVRITLPSECDFNQISIYAKFLKEMLTTPRIRELSYVILSRNHSTILQKLLTSNMMSFGPCFIKDTYVREIFVDNSQNTSLMHISVFNKLR